MCQDLTMTSTGTDILEISPTSDRFDFDFYGYPPDHPDAP